MTDIKRSCPVCDAHTSAVGLAVRDGENCPQCGAPNEIIREIDRLRAGVADAELKSRVEELLTENARLFTENRELRTTIDRVRYAMRESAAE